MMINWPADNEAITCVGFGDALLPVLIEAVENGRVEWVECIVSDKRTDGRYSEFDYLGFRYAVDEYYEPISEPTGERWDYVPVRVEKIAKVDVAGNGDTIIVEKYPLIHITPPKQPRPESWGSF